VRRTRFLDVAHGTFLLSLRIAGILEDLLPDDAFRGLIRVFPERLGKQGELG